MVGSARAATLQLVPSWGASGVPGYISMYIYVPDRPAARPPILVVSHFCGGSASAVFGQVQGGGIVAAADRYGFIMIFPQTTNPATSAKCWDVGSRQSLTHDGGGDTQAVAQMVKYTIATYQANPDRVYATGDSSGAMMTQALLGVYPDLFKAGASFAGVPAGCWSAGWTAASNWGGTCASGNDIMTAQQWGDLVRGMFPGYPGHRPRVQLFHGDADAIINYRNFTEAIKEWTNVLGLATNPTSTTSTGLTLGSHQATRQQWKDSCGQVALDAFTSVGGDHGPSDTLFNATYVIPFLGLDQTGDVDPQIAACGGAGGVTGAGGGTGAGGVTGAGGRAADGGVDRGGSGSGGSLTTAGVGGSGGSGNAGQGGAAGSAGSGPTGGASGHDGSGNGGSTTGPEPGSGSTGCSCALGGPGSRKLPGGVTTAATLGLALLAVARRRRRKP